jgi:mono/diheme cytochrome c family protein
VRRSLFQVVALSATLTPLVARVPATAQDAVDHWADVHPILAEHCYACHAGEQRKGGLALDSRAGVLRGGKSGAVVVEGDAGASRLVALVSSEDELERMPPKGRALSSHEVATLRAWIDAGVPWGEHEAGQMKSTPLALRPSEPESAAPHLVDAHIEDYLRLHEVEAGAAIDDAAFARRASLDVIGLLPTRAALQRFCADDAPDKRAALVDALLGDDQAYAEHWISFWNDVLRNDFQGTGYIDGGRAQITGWLYDALARNMPYDVLVRELVAPTSGASEGFIKGIVWRGDNAVVQQSPMQAAVNVSQVFLGVNLKCAACHDSFVNDWSLERTFALANCFSESPLSLVRCETDLGVAASHGFLWPELGAIDGALPRPERMAAVAGLVTTPENGYFTRTIVNRVWAIMMGRGLVEPLDEMEREAWHPALLDALALDFIAGGYDLRKLIRTLAISDVYQWAAAPAQEHADAEFVFRGPSARRLTAEQFYDALACLTGVGRTNPAFEVPGAAERGGFVRAWRVTLDPLSKALGRTAREQVTTRRETAGTTLQALELANGATLHAALRAGAEALCASWTGTRQELVAELFQRGLQRAPTPEELALLAPRDGAGAGPPSADALQDLLWALVMLPEFQLIH